MEESDIFCFNKLDEALQYIRNEQIRTNTRYIQFKKTKHFNKEDIDINEHTHIRFADPDKGRLQIPSDGTPFVFLGRMELECHLGSKRRPAKGDNSQWSTTKKPPDNSASSDDEDGNEEIEHYDSDDNNEVACDAAPVEQSQDEVVFMVPQSAAPVSEATALVKQMLADVRLPLHVYSELQVLANLLKTAEKQIGCLKAQVKRLNTFPQHPHSSTHSPQQANQNMFCQNCQNTVLLQQQNNNTFSQNQLNMISQQPQNLLLPHQQNKNVFSQNQPNSVSQQQQNFVLQKQQNKNVFSQNQPNSVSQQQQNFVLQKQQNKNMLFQNNQITITPQQQNKSTSQRAGNTPSQLKNWQPQQQMKKSAIQQSVSYSQPGTNLSDLEDNNWEEELTSQKKELTPKKRAKQPRKGGVNGITKKFGCPARIAAKSIIMFPTFKAESPHLTRDDRKQILMRLHTATLTPADKEYRCYVQFKGIHKHPTTDKADAERLPLDPIIKDKITELVTVHGLSKAEDVRKELEYFRETMGIPSTGTRFCPANYTIRNYIYRALHMPRGRAGDLCYKVRPEDTSPYKKARIKEETGSDKDEQQDSR